MCYKFCKKNKIYSSTGCDNRFSRIIGDHLFFFVDTRSSFSRSSLFRLVPNSKFLLTFLKWILVLRLLGLIWYISLMDQYIGVHIGPLQDILRHLGIGWHDTPVFICVNRWGGVVGFSIMWQVVMSVISKAIVVVVLNVKWILSNKSLLLLS